MRGAVAWVSFPRPGATRGRVQGGKRPAVIIQSAASFDQLGVVLVVPGTSKLAALRFPHTALVEPSAENGLTNPTVFLGFQLQPVDKTILEIPLIGRLSTQDMERIESAVRDALGFA